ncbi:vitelline membrane outer layer protein 1-like [Paroedura picta]|uniref:vitelline membrane outer layer protein 1-like n=1 Tax=Paroedura picta TaxID=143630 RepID=UPI004057ADFB
MQFTIASAVSLPLLCCLSGVEARSYTSILSVPNGLPFGEWGQMEFCPTGYAKGFSLKVHPYMGPFADDTSLNAIRLHCSDGSTITSLEGVSDRYGTWSSERSCKSGFLNSFSLRVTPPQGIRDDTAADNIMFTCTDGTELEGSGHDWGHYGKWSFSCQGGGICGIQTRVYFALFVGEDRTALNDVKFFCCS